MTPLKAVTAAPGMLRLESSGFRSGPVTIAYDARIFKPSVEEVKIDDERLKNSWGTRLYRILLTADNPPARGSWAIRITQSGA